MGQAPGTNHVSLRSFNRNFEGRSGTPSAQVYLCSPEVCTASAIKGIITDPRKLGKPIRVPVPKSFLIKDNMLVKPPKNPERVTVEMGPNIKPVPIKEKLSDSIEGEVLLKTGDNITTDHIMPAGPKVLPLRSNVPAIAEFVFGFVDPGFAKRAKEKNGGFIVGGENYGQGSSREHAALAPMYLGIKAVITKSFARIHFANLINFGIIPFTFAAGGDYEKIDQGDVLEFPDVKKCIANGEEVVIRNVSKNIEIPLRYNLTDRQKQIIFAGGLLNYTKNNGK
jgi:aconitate hydratase